jgi:peptidyl-prolyl cis-trans isomerase C
MRRPLALLALSLACACSSPGEPTAPAFVAPSSSKLPAGIVARVGSFSIGAETVAAVSSAQDLAPNVALEREIRDALFAGGALVAGLDRSPSAEAALRALLARASLESMKREASGADPTEAEVEEATARHFVELDRPEAFRVVHAVVRVPEDADAPVKARARALAERINEKVAKARDEAEFRSLVDSVDERGGLDVLVETLKPVAADGRVVDVEHPAESETFVPAFARAASRLTHPGQKSGVVPTDFGFHTMMLLERTPSHVVSLDERRRLLRDEIVTARAMKLEKQLLAGLKANVATTIERSADAELATVQVGGHEAP